MTVSLTISKTLSGAAVADSLAGGGTGIDLGSAVNAEYTPILDKTANTGYQAIYFRHDAVTDPITDFRSFIDEFSQTYGGADTAANDYATLVTKGNASSNSPNNNDGFGSGLRIEHDADLAGSLGASAFDATRAQVKIYGDNLTDGIDLASAFPLHVDALIYDANAHGSPGTAIDAVTPVTGKIGIDGDATLGDHALVKLRFYLADGAPDAGTLQWDWCVAYSFTA